MLIRPRQVVRIPFYLPPLEDATPLPWPMGMTIVRFQSSLACSTGSIRGMERGGEEERNGKIVMYKNQLRSLSPGICACSR